MTPILRTRLRDACACALVGFALRAVVVLWATDRVPPAADGTFYHTVATRIAAGLGYTWLWPDGAVTYAAHYPIGYPALLGAAYRLLGAEPSVAMWLNAALGVVGIVVVHALSWHTAVGVGLAERARTAGNMGALLVAVSPTLLGYTPALMTEGAVGVFVASAVWAGLRASLASGAPRRWGWLGITGLLMGAATLLRPQSLLLGPVLGALAWWSSGCDRLGDKLRGMVAGAVVLSVSLGVCLPWTLRNCQRMEHCVFVSANGGWNLLIGTFPEGHGAFVPIDGSRVPVECREVFQEAEKDICFGTAGRARIAQNVWGWLRLAPAKLRVTFEHNAAAAEYLGNAGVLEASAKWRLGAVEVISQRLGFLLVLLGVLRPDRRLAEGRRWAWVVAGLGLLFLGAGAHLAWLGLLVGASSRALLPLLRARRVPQIESRRQPIVQRAQPYVVQAALALLALTFLIHGVFFGAGRYTLPLLFLFAPLSALGWAWLPRTFDRSKPSG